MADRVFEPEIRLSLNYLRSNIPIAIECKKRESTTLPFTEVKDHQVEALSNFTLSPFVNKIAVPAAVGQGKQRFNLKTPFDFVYCGPGKAYILVNFRFTKKAPNKKIPKGNRAFAITVQQYKIAQALGGKSLHYNWFCEYATELKRVKYGDRHGWDLSPIGG